MKSTSLRFDRPTDGQGHRPRWTSAEVDAHCKLEEAFLLWADDHGLIWFDQDTLLARAIADVLGFALKFDSDN